MSLSKLSRRIWFWPRTLTALNLALATVRWPRQPQWTSLRWMKKSLSSIWSSRTILKREWSCSLKTMTPQTMFFICLRRLPELAVMEEPGQTLNTCQPITSKRDLRARKKALSPSYKPTRTCQGNRHRTRICSRLKAKWALRNHLFPFFPARSPRDKFYSVRSRWSHKSHSRRAFSKRSLKLSNPDSRLPTPKICPDKEQKSKRMDTTPIQIQTHTTRKTPKKLWLRT